jgi:hypothetical protein
LRHWSFSGINKHNRAIGHSKNSFNFTTKIGMSWGVNDINFDALPLDRNVFRKYRNAAFSLKVARIEYAFFFKLACSELAALTKKAVNKRCLAVINVRDYCHVANSVSSR